MRSLRYDDDDDDDDDYHPAAAATGLQLFTGCVFADWTTWFQ